MNIYMGHIFWGRTIYHFPGFSGIHGHRMKTYAPVVAFFVPSHVEQVGLSENTNFGHVT